ncbi:MAG: CAP domain-containing protein [bacterium]|nr:CAP domain-containing protein [bacterium]
MFVTALRAGMLLAAASIGLADNRVDLRRVEELIIDRTNEFRVEHQRAELRTSPELTRAARKFAAHMARVDRCTHTADGRQPADRAAAQQYDYCVISENIAYLYSSTRFVTRGLARRFCREWKDSPGHRRNMLDGALQEIGVGVARGNRPGKYYAVQMFGRPKSAQVTFQVTSRLDRGLRYTIGVHAFDLGPGHTRTHMLCLPSQVDLHGAGPVKPKRMADGPTTQPASEVLPDGSLSFEPDDGARYLVGEGGDGEYILETQLRPRPATAVPEAAPHESAEGKHPSAE